MLIYAHRGARGNNPEHTLKAYEYAIDSGADFLDADIQMTKDGVIIIYHDYALNPDVMRSQSGEFIKDKTLIKDLTYEQLQSYDIGRVNPESQYAKLFSDQKPCDGQRILALSDLLEWLKLKRWEYAKDRAIGLQLEVKYDPSNPDLTHPKDKIIKNLIEVLQTHGFINDYLEIQAFDWSVLQLIQSYNLKVRTAYLTDNAMFEKMQSPDNAIAGLFTAGLLLKDFQGSICQMIAYLGGKIWGPEVDQITEESIKDAKENRLDLIPWFDHYSKFKAESCYEYNAKESESIALNNFKDKGVHGLIMDWVLE